MDQALLISEVNTLETFLNLFRTEQLWVNFITKRMLVEEAERRQ